MKGDRIWSAEEAGVEVEKLIGSDPPIHREAWRQLKGWYWAAANCAPPPSPVTLERVMAERVDLYRYIPPLGANIPIYVEPFPVYDLVPMEDDIEWAVKRLQNHRSGGPSGMRAGHLKGWLLAARKKKKEEAATEQENPA